MGVICYNGNGTFKISGSFCELNLVLNFIADVLIATGHTLATIGELIYRHDNSSEDNITHDEH